MDEQKFKDRTKALALRVIRLVGALPKTERAADVIGKQLLRSGTSLDFGQKGEDISVSFTLI